MELLIPEDTRPVWEDPAVMFGFFYLAEFWNNMDPRTPPNEEWPYRHRINITKPSDENGPLLRISGGPYDDEAGVWIQPEPWSYVDTTPLPIGEWLN